MSLTAPMKRFRFVGGPCDGKSYEAPADIKGVKIPGDSRNPGFVKTGRGFAEFLYRRVRLSSGEEVFLPDNIEYIGETDLPDWKWLE